jgi:hypothetical protein
MNRDDWLKCMCMLLQLVFTMYVAVMVKGASWSVTGLCIICLLLGFILL